MKNEIPLVSILITVYNGMPYITKAIQHIQDQTYKNIEIIIVDDGSEDNTKNAIQDIIKIDKRIKLIRVNRIGRGKALNLGVKNCNGEYIAINDADDFSYKNRIEKQVNFLQHHPNHVLVGSLSNLYDLETGEVRNHSNHRPIQNKEIRKYFLKGQPIQHVCVLMRKKSIEDIGGYNENINFLYDRDLFIRLASKGGKLHNLEEVLVDVGHHSNRFFYSTYTGKERVKLDFHYRFKATKMLEVSIITKLKIWILYRWTLISPEYRAKIKKLLNRK